jgi:putative transposase/transposase-like zinc-binding protein
MAGAATSSSTNPCRPPTPYRPRRPEQTVLHRTVRDHLESFLQRAREEERPAPRFVEREFRAFLDCGILAHGFVRVHCDACGLDRLVAFSCKGRGFCPSCGGRRMAETAAQLVDSILPRVPIRQWVLTLPFPLRYRLAFDARLTQDVLGIFVRALFASNRRRVRERRACPTPHCGAVTFIQRFGDALNLNVHFHTLVLDGVYDGDPRHGAVFRALPPPESAEVEGVARRVVRRLMSLLVRCGIDYGADPSLADPLPLEQPLLAALYGASVAGRIATGQRAGQRVLRFGGGESGEVVEESSPRCVHFQGVSVHAEVGVRARDRRRLQRLCRYMGRPPVATRRLSALPDGRLLYRLKRRWRDGTTHVIFEPLEMMEKLAALVPPPRIHQVRYHGVLGPAAPGRGLIVPSVLSRPAVRSALPQRRMAPSSGAAPAALSVSAVATTTGVAPSALDAGKSAGPSSTTHARSDDLGGSAGGPVPKTIPWADLIRRVFAADVLECPRCGGRMRILAAIQNPRAIRDILDHLGLPSRAPPIAPSWTSHGPPPGEFIPTD